MRAATCALLSLAGAASTASATWSIVLIDTRTGEIAVGSATCLTNFDLQAGTPVLIPGIGAATAQSFVDQGGFNRVFIRDRLLEGVPPPEIVDLLSGFDNGHQGRQYGMADTMGGVATFTGSNAGAWAGGVTGRVGDVVYAVQGNVLTGDPVVTEAEQVIIGAINDGLDLAETMMLAMEEARVYGGDGRCSCSNNDPDGCGAPPDGWDPETGKSAHIAYMLIARAGDGFGCNSVYRAGRTTYGLASGDFDEDGLVDVAVASRGDSLISVLRNTGLSPHYVTLAPALVATASGAPTGLAAADFNRDGHVDLVYGDPSFDKLGLLYGAGDGTFSFPALVSAQDGATWVVAADFNNDSWPDAAVTNENAGTVSIMLNDGAGSLSAAQHLPAGQAPGAIVAAEIDGAPGIDLAAVDEDGAALTILANDGAGGFSVWQSLATDDGPWGVAAGDYDADGRTDLATANRVARTVSVFRQTSPGGFEAASVGDELLYTAIETLDADGDGADDFVASNDGTGGFTLFRGVAGGDPLAERFFASNGGANDLLAMDLSGDGRPDLVSNTRVSNSVTAVSGFEPERGYFSDGVGCATADYYMEFNVAFQSRDAPDPVEQLHDLYDDWRIGLIGVTDAVRSAADLATDRLPVGSSTTIVVEPLDWRLTQVGPGLTVHAVHGAGSAGLTALGPAHDNGDGTYTIEVSAADLPPEARGTDRLEVHVADGGASVILMPPLSLAVTGSIADWNGDGVVDAADVDAFLADWTAREDPTDLTGDGVIDTRDLVAFVGAWAGQ